MSNRIGRILGRTALALVAFAPAAAYAQGGAAACSYPAPASKPVLVSPLDGAQDAPTMLRTLVLQVAIPVGNDSSMPNLSDERVVLVDETPYPTEGGILHLAPPGVIPDVAPSALVEPNPTRRDTLRFVSTWVPALRAQTRYEVRLQLPHQGNCIYTTVGSFTTGSA